MNNELSWNKAEELSAHDKETIIAHLKKLNEQLVFVSVIMGVLAIICLLSVIGLATCLLCLVALGVTIARISDNKSACRQLEGNRFIWRDTKRESAYKGRAMVDGIKMRRLYGPHFGSFSNPGAPVLAFCFETSVGMYGRCMCVEKDLL